MPKWKVPDARDCFFKPSSSPCTYHSRFGIATWSVLSVARCASYFFLWEPRGWLRNSLINYLETFDFPFSASALVVVRFNITAIRRAQSASLSGSEWLLRCTLCYSEQKGKYTLTACCLGMWTRLLYFKVTEEPAPWSTFLDTSGVGFTTPACMPKRQIGREGGREGGWENERLWWGL